ncbi:MAG: hypothetical protein DMD49_10895 [Gemmatimonadetes bacterium]|nr:MAG: hypothetical protein DMD49_10895 [Gemmatimonadota bacterium]
MTVDGSTSQAIATNNSTGITFTGLAAGSHSVALSGVAANCSVTSANPQTVNVPSGGTATAAFTLSCTSPNTAPTVNAGPDETVAVGLFYTLTWSFSDPDNGPWSYTVDWGDGSSPTTGSASSPGTINSGHTYVLPLGQHTIRVTVTDSRAASGSDSKVVTVIL